MGKNSKVPTWDDEVEVLEKYPQFFEPKNVEDEAGPSNLSGIRDEFYSGGRGRM